jgi:hypothetical protein
MPDRQRGLEPGSAQMGGRGITVAQQER